MVVTLLSSIADRWIGRNAYAEPQALAAVAGLLPAVAVTGGSKGIGKAIARRVASGGDNVILIARGETALQAAETEIAKAAPGVLVASLALDVTDAGAPQSIVEFAKSRGLYVDVLVNNAAIGLSGEFTACDPATLDDLLQLNILALTRATRRLLPDMVARGRGGVLNLSSLGGYAPGPYQAAYYASKAYVTSLTEALRFETQGRGVRIALVAPGPVETRFHREMGADRAFYRWVVPSLDPDAVAGVVWRGFRLGRSTIVPGVVNNLLAAALWVLPHAVLVPIIAVLLAPGPRPPTRENG